ncbi:MAG TPA: GNAT family N-acetyltransferase [Mucilaginibacter sp.]|jgi:RimJ/RimL family protein N-acetyltransferase
MFKAVTFTVGDFEISPLKGEDLHRFDIMAEEVYAILSDEQTLRFIPEKRLKSKQEAVKWLQLSVVNFYTGRNYIHLIRAKSTGEILGIIDILSPGLVRDHYQLPSYPHFVEFYIKGELQGGSLMSKILPEVLQIIKKQNINVISAVADRNNLAAQKVLEKSGFAKVKRFDSTKDLFEAFNSKF